MNKNILGIIFSNMHDNSLGELTDHRTMGSVPFGGRYRFIDFPLSNMVNSGITNIGVVTKSNYQSLIDHIGSGREWDLARKRGGLYVLPPFSSSHSGIYRGRLEALAGIRSFISTQTADYILLSDCDVIANINYQEMVDTHISSGADITVMYKRMPIESSDLYETTAFELDEQHRVTDVMIGPQNKGYYNVYENVVIMSKELLERIIQETSQRSQYSFKRTILQGSRDRFDIRGYEYTGVSMTIHSIHGYFKANMQLLDKETRSSLFRPGNPIYTKIKDEVPAKYGMASRVVNSMIADGCVIDGTVENSIIFRGVKIARGAVVKNSIVMQGTTVGEGASMDYVMVDKDVFIREGKELKGSNTYPIYIAKGSVV